MYYSNIEYSDGFGAQYMKIIEIYIFCKLQNLNFVYRPLSIVEHNYNNDSNFVEKLESFINLKNNIPNINNYENVTFVQYELIMQYCESNIDAMFESDHFKFIKKCFWENKDKNVFNNDKTNVAVHIRRENIADQGLAGDRATTHISYYLNIMKVIREKYKNKNLLFHIYSQGDIEQFKILQEKDVEFHLDEDLCKTFLEFVAADILVISPSAFSFCAALLSDGEIYYKRFGHNPKKEWIECG
jgi:hypothetical protein